MQERRGTRPMRSRGQQRPRNPRQPRIRSWPAAALLAGWASSRKDTGVAGFWVRGNHRARPCAAGTTANGATGRCPRPAARPGSGSTGGGGDEPVPSAGGDTLETLAGLLARWPVEGSGGGDPPRGDDRRRALLTTRLSKAAPGGRFLSIDRTAVGPSTVPGAGRGLFAKGDWPRGTLLTCYPGDALVEFGHGSREGTDKVTWGAHARGSDTDTDALALREYVLRAVRDDWGIVAVPGTTRDTTDDPSYLGHYANDGAAPPAREAELAAYAIASADAANAVHRACGDGCHMATVATKDLSDGEEILVTYGPEYWSGHPSLGGGGGPGGPVGGGGSGERVGDGFGDGEWVGDGFDDGEWVEDEFAGDDSFDDNDNDGDLFDNDDDGYYDDETDAILGDIIASWEGPGESPTRGKGFG